MPPRKIPIESFGPELFNVLIEGSRRKLEVKTDYRNATKFRLRAHRLRKRMREEDHPMYRVAAKTMISITWDPNTEVIRARKGTTYPKDPLAPVTMTICPHDSQFAPMFAGLNIDLTAPIDSRLLTSEESKLINQETPTTAESIPTIEDLLKDFK